MNHWFNSLVLKLRTRCEQLVDISMKMCWIVFKGIPDVFWELHVEAIKQAKKIRKCSRGVWDVFQDNGFLQHKGNINDCVVIIIKHCEDPHLDAFHLFVICISCLTKQKHHWNNVL